MTATAKIPLTKSQIVRDDISALVRARNPLLWIVTKEEARVEGFIAEAVSGAGYVPRMWDIAQGVTELDGKKAKIGTPDPGETLTAIRARAEDATEKPERGAWIMRDLAPWLDGLGGAPALRQLRNLARLLPGTPQARAQTIIVLSTAATVPPELSGHATVIEWPLPDRAEIAAILDAAVSVLPERDKEGAPLRANALPEGTRDAAIDAAVGLSGEEAQACFARSLVQTRKIDPKLVTNEKRRVIAREKVLEWIDPIPGGLKEVGGLENLKTWLVGRKNAYSQAARDYGLPEPRGVFLAGISGCGKSLTAKTVAAEWGVPLIKFDFGALKDKFVGGSEGNIRKAFAVIEAMGRCAIWVDEIEKALQGATSGSSDGGVSADALGAFLTWMQEHRGGAFVIATANDVSSLPPELLRKGRFDEFFFVDLPNADERKAVLTTALATNKRAHVKIDLAAVTAKCVNFTGSEIAELVPTALFAAFAEGAREITTADLIEAAKDTTPLSKTAEEKITALRTWAKGKARPATRTVESETTAQTGGRALDF